MKTVYRSQPGHASDANISVFVDCKRIQCLGCCYILWYIQSTQKSARKVLLSINFTTMHVDGLPIQLKVSYRINEFIYTCNHAVNIL